MFKSCKAKPASYEQALAELPAAETALSAESAEYAQAYAQRVREFHRLQAVMAREKARTAAVICLA